MNTNKNISDEKLGELFREIPLENPSANFTEKLFRQIEKEALREERKHQWMTVGQMAAGITGVLTLPALAIYLCTVFLPGFSFTFPKIHLNLNLNVITIGFSVLMLLILDSLFRMHTANRRTKND
jgi:hypothetical protein